jgi:hypothetical protein
MNEKIDDGNYHIWTPSRFWGDQICYLSVGKQLADGKDIYEKAWADEGELCDNELANWIKNNG